MNDDDLIKAVERNTTVSGVAVELGIGNGKGSRDFVKSRIKDLGLNTNHFTGFKQGNRAGVKHELDEILIQNSSYNNNKHLKDRLIQANLLGNTCSECGISKWMDKPITLQLDHINGDNKDNRIENLRLICPNCHSQTSTFAGRNKKIKPDKRKCQDCGVEMNKGRSTRKRCWSCHVNHRKILSPAVG